MTERYQLRYAAGMYWLIDMEQSGLKFQKPACLNESGVYLWDLARSGMQKEQIAEQLCSEFGLEKEQALQDVDSFLKQLEQNGIVLQ